MFPVLPPLALDLQPLPLVLPVTNGHKCIPDISRHLLLDGVLHVIVGLLDELLEDWPPKKPRGGGVSFSSERGETTPPASTQLHPRAAPGKVEKGQQVWPCPGLMHWTGSLWEGRSDLRLPWAQSQIYFKSVIAPEPRTNSRNSE